MHIQPHRKAPLTGDISEVGEPSWLRRGQIPSLNGLRAVAVILVILAHAHQTSGFPSFAPLHWIGDQGAIGVDVFFVLSFCCGSGAS